MPARQPAAINQDIQANSFEVDYEQLMAEQRLRAGISALGHFADEAMHVLEVKMASQQVTYYQGQFLDAFGTPSATKAHLSRDTAAQHQAAAGQAAELSQKKAAVDYAFYRGEKIESPEIREGELHIIAVGDDEQRSRSQALGADFKQFRRYYSPLYGEEAAERNRAIREDQAYLVDPALPETAMQATIARKPPKPTLNPRKLLPPGFASIHELPPDVLVAAEFFRQGLLMASALNAKKVVDRKVAESAATSHATSRSEYAQLLELPRSELLHKQEIALLAAGKHVKALRAAGLVPDAITAKGPKTFIEQVRAKLGKANTPERRKVSDDLKWLLAYIYQPAQKPPEIKAQRLSPKQSR